MDNIFFLETLGLSSRYGIGSYRKHLLPEVARMGIFKNVYLVQIGIAAKDEVTVRQEADNVTVIGIFFYIPALAAGKPVDFYIDEMMAERCYQVLLQETGCSGGVVHMNVTGQYQVARIFKSYYFQIVYTHHFSTLGTNGQNNGKFAENAYMEEQAFNIADQIIFLSAPTQQQYVKVFGLDRKKCNLISNGISFHQHHMENDARRQLKQSFGFRKKDFIFLYVGRVSKEKGIYELLHAFSVLCDNLHDIHLIVAGDGDFERAFMFAAGKMANIHFTGFLPKNKLEDIYRIANAGILVSYAEQSSYTVLEQMSYDIPMIVSDIDSFRGLKANKEVLKIKVVKEGVDIKGVDPTSAYKAMARIYEDSALRKQLSRNAKSMLRRQHSAIGMAEKTVNVYEKTQVISPEIFWFNTEN